MITSSKKSGFTIVELLIVIVVIGILAVIAIVSYSGIKQRAIISSLQSDLSSSATALKLYNVEHGTYPQSIDGSGCPIGPSDTKYCLRPSSNNSYLYSSVAPYSSFVLTATNNSTSYSLSDDASAMPATIINSRAWLQNSLNVGNMITGATTPTNNSVVEKWCYGDLESNCTQYGALYAWDEVMQYSTTEGSQGICPVGFHIPTNAEWTTMINYLGSSTAGTQLKVGGATNFNALLSGANLGGSFSSLNTSSYVWSSSEYDSTRSWTRNFWSGASVGSSYDFKTRGFSVRCVSQ